MDGVLLYEDMIVGHFQPMSCSCGRPLSPTYVSSNVITITMIDDQLVRDHSMILMHYCPHKANLSSTHDENEDDDEDDEDEDDDNDED